MGLVTGRRLSLGMDNGWVNGIVIALGVGIGLGIDKGRGIGLRMDNIIGRAIIPGTVTPHRVTVIGRVDGPRKDIVRGVGRGVGVGIGRAIVDHNLA